MARLCWFLDHVESLCPGLGGRFALGSRVACIEFRQRNEENLRNFSDYTGSAGYTGGRRSVSKRSQWTLLKSATNPSAAPAQIS
jgi:hypothetical protein